MQRSLVLLLTSTLACTTGLPAPDSSENRTLDPCPASPNCVSSQAHDELHEVAPILLTDDTAQTWNTLVEIVVATPRTEVVTQRPGYLHVVVTTPMMRFADDFALWLRPGGSVAVRSASRLGWGDFGVNRKRVEALRAKLVAAGVAHPH